MAWWKIFNKPVEQSSDTSSEVTDLRASLKQALNQTLKQEAEQQQKKVLQKAQEQTAAEEKQKQRAMDLLRVQLKYGLGISKPLTTNPVQVDGLWFEAGCYYTGHTYDDGVTVDQYTWLFVLLLPCPNCGSLRAAHTCGVTDFDAIWRDCQNLERGPYGNRYKDWREKFRLSSSHEYLRKQYQKEYGVTTWEAIIAAYQQKTKSDVAKILQNFEEDKVKFPMYPSCPKGCSG